jgi:biotin carboxyl carrier protein
VLRRYSVKIGGSERIVELEDLDGKVRAVVDGNERLLDARLVEPGVWSLLEGDLQTVARVDGAAPKVTVAIARPGEDPLIVSAEVETARSAGLAALAKRADAGGGAPAALRSPMPGRVKVGDRVTAGQAAVVVEAMKMENELRATRAGTVQELRCAEGAAVEAGQDLVVIG